MVFSMEGKNSFMILLGCLCGLLLFCTQALGFQCGLEPTNELITYGDVVTCSIGTVGDMDQFRFIGNSGEMVALQVAKQSGTGISCVELFGPDGVLDDSDCSSAARINVRLAQSGTYTVLVSEQGSNSTINYALALERIDPPSLSATSIASGEVIEGAIDPVGDVDLFRFEGADGDTIALQVAKQSGTGISCLELFGPDGALDDSYCSSAARINVRLDQSGTYSVLVSEQGSNSTINYALALERIAPPSLSALSIAPGEVVEGAIDPVGDVDLFRFEGADGDMIALQVAKQSGTGISCVELFGPDGVLDDSYCSSAARINVRLEQSGTYTVLVSEQGSNSTINYALALERIAPPSKSVTSIAPGEVIEDAIDPVGDVDLFRFEGADGDTIVLQVAKQSGTGISCVELFGPDGVLDDSYCSSAARINVRLDQSGTYTVLVSEQGSNSTINYAITYECIGKCPSGCPEFEPGPDACSSVCFCDDGQRDCDCDAD